MDFGRGCLRFVCSKIPGLRRSIDAVIYVLCVIMNPASSCRQRLINFFSYRNNSTKCLVVPEEPEDREADHNGFREDIKNGEMRKENQILKLNLHEAESQILSLKDSNDCLQRENTELENRLREAESRVLSLKLTKDSLQQENAKLKDQVRELEDDLDKSREEISAGKFRREGLTETERRLKISELEEEVEKLRSKQVMLSDLNSGLEAREHQSQEEVERLKRQLEGMKKEENEHRHLTVDLNMQIKNLQEKTEEYRQTNEKLKSEEKEWQKERNELREKVIILEENNKSLEEEVSGLRHRISQAETLRETRETSEAASLRAEISRLRQQHEFEREEMDKRCAAIQKELQSQLEIFFRELMQDERMKQGTFRMAVEQTAQSIPGINSLYNAAVRNYQERRYGPPVSVKEVPDD